MATSCKQDRGRDEGVKQVRIARDGRIGTLDAQTTILHHDLEVSFFKPELLTTWFFTFAHVAQNYRILQNILLVPT